MERSGEEHSRHGAGAGVRGFQEMLVGSENQYGKETMSEARKASQVTAGGSGLCEGGRTWTG